MKERKKQPQRESAEVFNETLKRMLNTPPNPRVKKQPEKRKK
jgi:hypothetical protein